MQQDYDGTNIKGALYINVSTGMRFGFFTTKGKAYTNSETITFTTPFTMFSIWTRYYDGSAAEVDRALTTSTQHKLGYFYNSGTTAKHADNTSNASKTSFTFGREYICIMIGY